ncbi:MAG TPA: nucleotide pyrophosphohydrolase [Candidatus Saccharimonadales bacterium]
MSLADYQKQVDDTVAPYKTPYWSSLSQLAQLSEEVGEIARILNHQYGDKVKKPTEKDDDLEGELGDLLFALICLANDEGVDLDMAMQKVLHKITTRDAERFEKKS